MYWYLGLFPLTVYLIIGFAYAKYAVSLMQSGSTSEEFKDEKRTQQFEATVFLFWPLFMWTAYKAKRLVDSWHKKRED